MKKLLFITSIIITLTACTKTEKPREITQISLEKYKIDSSSIRAIEIINDSTVVYAGSRGDLGVVRGNEIIPIASKIKTDTIVPHFRSLALTESDIFMLSIANPALLYRNTENRIELVYKEDNEKVFYDAMKFFDDLNGIAMGDPVDNCLSILITRDGGTTWNKVKCEFLPEIEPGEAAFAASNTNIVVKGKNAWIVTGGKRARVFHSSDMGRTWNVYNTPIIEGKETTGIYTAAFYNNKQGIICGGDYLNKFGESANKAITNDGGKTWSLVAENSAPHYVSCVQYVPNSEGKELFAVSTNGIFFSNNSGENWKKVSDEGFYSIRIANKNTAWLSGNEVIAKLNFN
ncbi:oxidoreductase [Lutibacter holmesii]|uniref:Oxidoreductase n=1 Tax=Lutibacter holmesii TaxID=1137985 RepID=A0ABW3WNW4_9FLAO